MAEDNTLKSLTEVLTKEFDKQELCDVFFSVGGKTIGAHKLVLKVRSQHLFEMASGWNLGNEPIPVEDMAFETFKAILRYMYSGHTDITNANIFTFMAASVQFKMTSLEKLCVEHFAESMSTENVCIYMNEAVKFNSTLLQEKCCKTFSEETMGVVLGDNFEKLSQPALSALLDVDQIDLVEIALFFYIRSWMMQQCQEQGLPVNGTNMRHVIGDALYKIRFPTMNVQDFANHVTTIKGLLTDSEMAQIFQKITLYDSESIECPFSDKFRCKNNIFSVLSSVMQNFLKSKLVPSMTTEEFFDCSSALKLTKEAQNHGDIRLPLHCIRYISQCIADLANSFPISRELIAEDRAIRDELYDEFLVWQDTAETGNVSDIMTQFQQLRMKSHDLQF